MVGDGAFYLKSAIEVTHPPPSKIADVDRFPHVTSQQ